MAIDALTQSSCLVQARWGWADHSTSGRYGTKFQTYRLNRNYLPSSGNDPYNYGFDVITTRSKLRGHGKSLSLRMESESGKDMHILGWAIDFTIETDE